MPIDQRLVELWESSGARARGTPLAEFRTNEKDRGSNCTIGFCTAIKGPERFPLLLESLKTNIDLYHQIWWREHYKPRVHFVVLAYGEPELEAFMLEHFKEEIKEGIVTFATVDAEHFEYAPAKNTAHRIALDYLHCDVVCNLDGDNVLGKGGRKEYGTDHIPDFITFLQHTFRHYPKEVLVRPMSNKEGELGAPLMRGIGGRIAMPRETFWRVRGYDEENFRHWGGDDQDIMTRVMALFRPGHYTPVRFVPVSDPLTAGDVIAHDPDIRWKYLPPDLQPHSRSIEAISAHRWEHPEEISPQQGDTLAALLMHPHKDLYLYANPDGWKHNSVKIAHARKQGFDYKNFKLTQLPPLQSFQLEKRKTQPTQRLHPPEWEKEFVTKTLEGMPEFYKKAFLYVASRRQKFEGREPLETVLTRLLSCARFPEKMKLIMNEYTQYLSNCEQYGIDAHPEKSEAQNPSTFAQRYGKNRQGKGNQIAK